MTEGSGARIALRDAVKRYDDVTALDGISLDIRSGEFLTLLGPSGSGKTTTLNAIAGFIDLTKGEIDLDGEPIAPIPPHRRNIGVIFQNYALFPHMTAANNVAYALRQRRVPRHDRDDRVRKALDLVGLSDIGKRYPRELSGGQQQRVALARAIVFNPRVLLMDEPLGALDRRLREGLQREIKGIHRDLGITFVYVTHDQEEALALSDRIAVFNRGRIEQLGRPADLYEAPQNRFVAEFMGESNIFDGSLRDGVLTDTFAGDLRVPASEQRPDCCLVVRPQRIRMTKEVLDGADNRLTGEVADVSYLGPTRRVIVQVAGGSLLIREDAHSAVPVELGDQVHLSWNAGDGLLISNGPAGSANGEPTLEHSPSRVEANVKTGPWHG